MYSFIFRIFFYLHGCVISYLYSTDLINIYPSPHHHKKIDLIKIGQTDKLTRVGYYMTYRVQCLLRICFNTVSLKFYNSGNNTGPTKDNLSSHMQ